MANDYNMSGITLDVPDFGILNNLMVVSFAHKIFSIVNKLKQFSLQGSYKATGTFYGRSTPENKVGCIEFTFSFVPGK